MRLLLILLLACCVPRVADAQASHAPASPAVQQHRVLLVGNSLLYTWNTPGLLRAIAVSQPGGPRIETASYLAPGGTLAERWKDGDAARALQQQAFDVVVLQERGGLLACMADADARRERECRASREAHAQFIDAARARGARVLLIGTWGPDTAWQRKLDDGLRALARGQDATPLFVGARLRDTAARDRATPMFLDDAALHPSLPGALVQAAMLYRAITGQAPRPLDLFIDAPLLPADARVEGATPMETQAALRGDGKPVKIAGAALAGLYAVAAGD